MTKAAAIVPHEPEVYIRDGEIFTDSQKVATFFGKDHNKVLRDIRTLDISDEFRASNFGQTLVYGAFGATERTITVVEMNFDGFMFLAMGYRGKKAGEIKERYIAAFKRMKDELERRRAAPVAPPSIDFHDTLQLTELASSLANFAREMKARADVAEAKVEEARPALEFYDEFRTADGLYGLQNAARALHQSPNRFIAWMKREYHRMPSGVLGGLSPAQAWNRLVADGVRRPPDPDDMRRAFGTRIRRKVSGRGVRVFGCHYRHPDIIDAWEANGDLEVEVFVDETDLGLVSVRLAQDRWVEAEAEDRGLRPVARAHGAGLRGPGGAGLPAFADVTDPFANRLIMDEALRDIDAIAARSRRRSGVFDPDQFAESERSLKGRPEEPSRPPRNAAAGAASRRGAAGRHDPRSGRGRATEPPLRRAPEIERVPPAEEDRNEPEEPEAVDPVERGAQPPKPKRRRRRRGRSRKGRGRRGRCAARRASPSTTSPGELTCRDGPNRRTHQRGRGAGRLVRTRAADGVARPRRPRSGPKIALLKRCISAWSATTSSVCAFTVCSSTR